MQNMIISENIHANYAQLGRILRPTSDHIVSKYEADRIVTFRDMAKIANFRNLNSIIGGVTSSGNREIPACVFNFLNILPMSDESICSIRIYLH